jgi:hypothetical protein
MFGLLFSRSACVLALTALAGCSRPAWNRELPSSESLGQPRGFRIARTVLHLHSPYSYDACDKKGLEGGVVNEACLGDLRSALCMDRIDAAFLSDHPNHMADYAFSDLLLSRGTDRVVTGASGSLSNLISGCANGHEPLVSVGFESRLMTLGMDHHAPGDVQTRGSLYTSETNAAVTQIRSDTGGLVMIPHTESRSVSLIETLDPDGVEIYNFHANMDPKIRKASLGLPQFDNVMDILPYWIDPYHQEEPDLAILAFYQVSDVYARIWNQLLSDGKKYTGFAGNDSHQNTLPYKASDGERLDSHRRLMRWFTNHFLVAGLGLEAIRSAIQAGRGWMVAEGLGTPVGADFYAQAGGTSVSVGGTGSFVAGNTRIYSPLPALHSSSPQGKVKPIVIQRLRKVSAPDQAPIVATVVNRDLDYAVDQSGIYRLEISIVPLHLAPWADIDLDKTEQEFLWIVTNPIYLN